MLRIHTPVGNKLALAAAACFFIYILIDTKTLVGSSFNELPRPECLTDLQAAAALQWERKLGAYKGKLYYECITQQYKELHSEVAKAEMTREMEMREEETPQETLCNVMNSPWKAVRIFYIEQQYQVIEELNTLRDATQLKKPILRSGTGRLISRVYPSLGALVNEWKPDAGDTIHEFVREPSPGHVVLYEGNSSSAIVHLAITTEKIEAFDSEGERELYALGRMYRIRRHDVHYYTSKFPKASRVNNSYRSLVEFYPGEKIVENAGAEVSGRYVHFDLKLANCSMFACFCSTGLYENVTQEWKDAKANSLLEGHYEEVKTFFLRVMKKDHSPHGISSSTSHTVIEQPYMWIVDILGREIGFCFLSNLHARNVLKPIETLVVDEKGAKLDEKAGYPTYNSAGRTESEVQHMNGIAKNIDGRLAINLTVGPKFRSLVKCSIQEHENIGKNLRRGLWIAVGSDPDKLVTYYLPRRKDPERPEYLHNDDIHLEDLGPQRSLVLVLDHEETEVVEDHIEELPKIVYHGVLFKQSRDTGKLIPEPIEHDSRVYMSPGQSKIKPHYPPHKPDDNLVGNWHSTLEELLAAGEQLEKADIIEIGVPEGSPSSPLCQTPDFTMLMDVDKRDDASNKENIAPSDKGPVFAVYNNDGEGDVHGVQHQQDGVNHNKNSSHTLIHLHEIHPGAREYRISVDSFENALELHGVTRDGSTKKFRINNRYKQRGYGGRPYHMGYFSKEQIIDRAMAEVSHNVIGECEAPNVYAYGRVKKTLNICQAFALYSASGRLDDFGWLLGEVSN